MIADTVVTVLSGKYARSILITVTHIRMTGRKWRCQMIDEKRVLQVAREELFFETIRAVVHRDNEKSLRLCKKLGFIVDNKAEKDENPWIFLKKSLK